MTAGWRLVLARIDSGRVYVPRTGRPVSQAATARSGWIDRSSLPPKPPPQALGMTRTCSGRRPTIRAISSRSMYGVWVVAQTSRRSPTRRAQPASGSMYACSTKDVRNSPETTTAAAASASSTSPCATRPRTSTLPGSSSWIATAPGASAASTSSGASGSHATGSSSSRTEATASASPTSARTGSPMWRTTPSARTGWSLPVS